MSWEDLIKRITYKQGVTIDYHRDFESDRETIIVLAWVEDTYRPGRKIQINTVQELPPFFDEQTSLRVIRNVFRDFEIHECYEWLKVDGKLVDNPHKFTTIDVTPQPKETASGTT